MSSEWEELQRLRVVDAAPPVAATGRVLSVSIEEYHNDPCEEISLSASIGKLMVDRSPAHAYSAHPRLGGVRFESTKAQDAGSLIHRLLLGKGAEIVEVHADSYRTKAAQDLRDACKAQGRIPVLSETLAEAREAATALQERLASFGILLHGESEVAVEWDEPVFLADGTVKCRAMFDHVIRSEGMVFDLKKIANAHPDAVARAMVTYAYDVQEAAYRSAFTAVYPEWVGREDFLFLFLEMEPPYAVLPVRTDGQFRAMGEKRWQRAVSTWRHCRRDNFWPGYSTEPIRISPPAWAAAKELP